MKDIISFLTELGNHNNKIWFDAHKDWYCACKSKWDTFALQFLHDVELMDSDVHGLTISDITYRIYRDLRFSQDKRPYKWHLCVYVCPKGKKSGMGGYYVHIEPLTNTYFLCGGLYNPAPASLYSIREQIMLEPQEFHAAVEQCSGFSLPWENALKRFPKGFSADSPYADYYRLRSFEVVKSLTLDEVLDGEFSTFAVRELRRTVPFTQLLNRCVSYAKEKGGF